METKNIFISYSRSDSDFVLKLAKDLRDAGTEFWLDQLDIKVGSHWDASIQEALTSAQYVIVVLSPAAVESTNVMDEVSFALENGKIVIPILLSECTTPFRLRRLQHIDFTKDYQISLNKLIKALSSTEEKDIPPDIKSSQNSSKKSTLKKYILFGCGAVLLVFGIWWAVTSGSAKTDDQKNFNQALQKNDSSSYALYLKNFPNGLYSQQAREKLDSIRKKVTNECAIWKSNIEIIKKTYSNSLGTGGKTYTNRSKLKLEVSNIALDSDENLNKLKNKLLNLIENSPSYSDPNYDMEFTKEASLIREQIEIEIQKHVDKCK